MRADCEFPGNATHAPENCKCPEKDGFTPDQFTLTKTYSRGYPACIWKEKADNYFDIDVDGNRMIVEKRKASPEAANEALGVNAFGLEVCGFLE